MQSVPRPPGRAQVRVARTLRERNVQPWMLADARLRARLARDAHVERAVRCLAVDRWRCGRHLPIDELLDRLWPGLAARPCAYVFDARGAVAGERQTSAAPHATL